MRPSRPSVRAATGGTGAHGPRRPRSCARWASTSRTCSASPPASTRTPSASTRWPRWGSASSRSARSPREPQPGNPRPRLFRLPADRARGQPDGLQQRRRRGGRAPARLRGAAGRRDVVVGVNIGKTKVVPEDAAVADYEKSTALLGAARRLPRGQRLARPNTPGLRDLQAVEQLEPLLRAVRRRADDVADAARAAAGEDRARTSPTRTSLAVADLALAVGLDGIVATNTTIARDGLASTRSRRRGGRCAAGSPGAPLRERADRGAAAAARPGRRRPHAHRCRRHQRRRRRAARLDAGATLLQAYTGFVYEGPLWPSRMQRLRSRTHRKG